MIVRQRRRKAPQRAGEKRLRLGGAAGALEQQRQVVLRHRHVRMIGAEQRPFDRQGPAVVGFRFGDPSLRLANASQVVQRATS